MFNKWNWKSRLKQRLKQTVMCCLQKLLFGIFSVTLCVFSLFRFLFTLSIFKAKLLVPWSCTRKGKRDHTYDLMLVHKICLFFIFFLSSLQPSSAGWLLIKVDNKSWCLINFYLLKNDWTAPRLKHFYLLNLTLQTTSFHFFEVLCSRNGQKLFGDWSPSRQSYQQPLDGWMAPTPKTVPWWMVPIIAMTFLSLLFTFSFQFLSKTLRYTVHLSVSFTLPLSVKSLLSFSVALFLLLHVGISSFLSFFHPVFLSVPKPLWALFCQNQCISSTSIFLQ